MFKFSVVLFGVLVTIVTGKFQPSPDICNGLDVSREPRLEARQLDGWWFSHRVLSKGFPSNSIFFIQFQGRVAWSNDWNADPNTCTYRKFEDTQRQSVTVGPFSPCVSDKQVLPVVRPANDFLYWLKKDILIFYLCSVGAQNNRCPEDPFIRVMTRNRNITRRQLDIVRRQLKRLGVNLDSLAVVDARANRCPLPKQTFFGSGQKRGYGRKRERW